MPKVIYADAKHEVLIETYIQLNKEFAEEVSTASKYNNYLEVLEIILDYHNAYGDGINQNNFFDWMMIIPLNLSVMTNGFFAGIETSRNRAKINGYRTLLTNILEDTVDSIDKMEFKNV